MNLLLLHKWKFHYNDCPEAWYKGYPDDSWEEVSVPHDWSVHMPFSREYSSGTGYLAGGIGWYRTSFQLPESLRGKRIFITFDGVYKNSQVWCNSYYLGKRPYGYTTFRYDITEQVSFGTASNLIAVRVDHRDIADSRWFTGSGIIRKAAITVEEPVHPDFNGIFFKTPKVSAEKADIEIMNTIVNETAAEAEITVESRLSFRGAEVACFRSCGILPAGTAGRIITKGSLENPALWSVDEPNLYQLTTRTCPAAPNDTCQSEDINPQTVGIRKIHFDADNGFFLNDRPLKIKGVCVHHDVGCLGAAVSSEVWLRRLYYLKKMGCNAIRMSHNPHMPELYDLCDSLGFLVMDEAFDEWEGVKNKWSAGHNVYPPKHQGYFEDFPEWHERDLSDLIKRDRNHPSIIMWSIGNEIDYPNDPYCHPLFDSMTGNNDNNKPKAERQYNPDKPNAERLSAIAAGLTRIVKMHDTTRPVTAAVAFPELSTQIGFIDSFDVVGYNYKEQYYENDHRRFPEKPFLGSENSHSYQAWKAVRDHKFISSQFLWTGIDYLGEAQGWPVHGSQAGILTLAGYPKVSYYRRQSYWSEKPVLYLATARADTDENGSFIETGPKEWKHMYRSWNYLAGEPVEVRCYTNLPSARLFCNGKDIGEKEFDEELGYIFWIIPYEKGELTVTGKDPGNPAVTISDSISYTGRGCNIELKLWNCPASNTADIPGMTTASEAALPDCAAAAFIKQLEVTVTDEEGRWVSSDSTSLQVEVSGSGSLIGLENGDLADFTEYGSTYRRALEGRLLIYVSDSSEAKTTTVTVKGAGLKTAVIQC